MTFSRVTQVRMKPHQLIEFQTFRLSTALIRALPLRTAQRLAAAAARRIFDRVGYALVNLHIAFPELSDEARREIGRHSYVHFAWNLIDDARAERWNDEEVRDHIRINGLEHLDAALKAGKGAVLIGLLPSTYTLIRERRSLAASPITERESN